MVLVWQFGSVFILTAVSGCMGRYILNWRSLIATAPSLASIKQHKS